MQTSQPRILLVIVNFNQDREIENFLTSLGAHWAKEDSILIDDGSSDSSVTIAKRLGYKVFKHEINKGVGAAIRSGIIQARANGYDSVLIMSSNGKMIPTEIPAITRPILENKADYVTGSRFLVGGGSPGLSLFRRLSIPLFSFICTVLLGRKFSDITCGFRCYKIDFLFNGTCDIHQDWLSRYELEYYIHYWACHQGLRIHEIPVTIKYSHLEKKRTSKIRPILDWWSMIKPLFYLRLKLRK